MSGLFIIPEVIVLIAALLWLLMLQVVYTMMVTYKLTLRQLLGNAMRMALGKLPLFLGLRLLTSILPLGIAFVFLYFPERATFPLARRRLLLPRVWAGAEQADLRLAGQRPVRSVPQPQHRRAGEHRHALADAPAGRGGL